MPDSGEPSQPAQAGERSITGDPHRRAIPRTAAEPALRHLRAAQLRARAVRGGLVKVAFGTVFLVGALAHSLSPERHERSSLFWMTLLVLMSTVNIALGFRVFRAGAPPSRPGLADSGQRLGTAGRGAAGAAAAPMTTSAQAGQGPVVLITGASSGNRSRRRPPFRLSWVARVRQHAPSRKR